MFFILFNYFSRQGIALSGKKNQFFVVKGNMKPLGDKRPQLPTSADALLNVPGHIIPTESPQTAQAIKLSCGMGSREIPK